MTCFEGVVTFAAQPTTSFRYAVQETRDNQPVIWLEDRKSREQWYGFAGCFSTA